MAKETRRQRRDARREAGAESGALQRVRPRPATATGPAAEPLEAPAPHGAGRSRKAGNFVRESAAELRKVEWPGRAQVIQGTIVVIIACAIVGAYLYGVDQVLRRVVQDIFI